jgi:hypothetical protein
MKFTFAQIISEFDKEKPRRKVFGNYRIVGDDLIYKSSSPNFPEDVIAKKLPTGVKLANSSILPNIGARHNWGRHRRNTRQTDIQRLLSESKGYFNIPFTVFKEANLDITKFTLIEKAAEEDVVVTVVDRYDYELGKQLYKDEKRHFTGASLFEVDGKQYLFDIDRVEIGNKIFNPFLATLKVKCKTIKEAYQSLKPEEVLKAEKKKLKVLRQGEWFFIPIKKAPKLPVWTRKDLLTAVNGTWSEQQAVKAKYATALSLKAGNSRPNTCTKGMTIKGVAYCSGKVSHTGREHKDLILGKKWYKAVPNTSVANFTISGDID